ncbi:MAG: hypothetical protein RRA94_06355 [Bacteroidota bacterium]|nr:hypothetical protein [Bacteroidota bacterium]
MAHELKFQDKGRYLRVELRGARSPTREGALLIETWSTIAAYCIEHGHSRILGVVHLKEALNPMAAYEVAHAPHLFGWKHAFRLALVYPEPEVFESNRLTETILTNRGYQIRVFSEEEEALRWLMK